jgi:uncharacterized membrane protein
MKQTRLDSLADGIFAIVMTILVFELRVPDLHGIVTNQSLWKALQVNQLLFMSYFLSFAFLFTYWRSHHFIASVYAKNINIQLTNINALFLFFVALVPFSSHLLGLYSHTQTAIIIFAVHTICIGVTLFWMRRYVHVSDKIENTQMDKTELRHSYIRVLFPIFSALVAIVVCFFHTEIALTLLTLGVIFNLLPKSTTIVSWFIDPFLD